MTRIPAESNVSIKSHARLPLRLFFEGARRFSGLTVGGNPDPLPPLSPVWCDHRDESLRRKRSDFQPGHSPGFAPQNAPENPAAGCCHQIPCGIEVNPMGTKRCQNLTGIPVHLILRALPRRINRGIIVAGHSAFQSQAVNRFPPRRVTPRTRRYHNTGPAVTGTWTVPALRVQCIVTDNSERTRRVIGMVNRRLIESDCSIIEENASAAPGSAVRPKRQCGEPGRAACCGVCAAVATFDIPCAKLASEIEQELTVG